MSSVPWTDGSDANLNTACEVHGTRRERIGFGGAPNTASVQIDVPYNYRFDFYHEVLKHRMGQWPGQIDNDDSVANLKMFLADVDFTPVPKATATYEGEAFFEYERCIVTLYYSSDAAPNSYRESFEPNTEFRVLPIDGFFWPNNADGVPEPITQKEAVGVQVRGSQYTVVFNNVWDYNPYSGEPFDIAGVLGMNGTVNGSTLYYKAKPSLSSDPTESFASILGSGNFPGHRIECLPEQALIHVSNVKRNELAPVFWSKLGTWVNMGSWSYQIKIMMRGQWNQSQDSGNEPETWNTFFRKRTYEPILWIDPMTSDPPELFKLFPLSNSILEYLPPTWQQGL